MFKINPSKYMGVTVLPSQIAENHLILSSANQLKVIIYAFYLSNNPFNEEDICKGTGIEINEVKDALSYWQNLGFILPYDAEIVLDNNEASNQKIEKQEALQTEKKENSKKSLASVIQKLSYEEIYTRINESSKVRYLLNEAQIKLGRTIGTNDQSSLIILHDYFGLPVEVILTICEYARSKGKSTNTSYIYKIGVDWSQREIDTLERADEELKQIENKNIAWSNFCRLVNIPSSNPTQLQENYIYTWTEKWKFSESMLILAYEEMKNNTSKTSYSYMNKVLSSWYMKKIDTPEKVYNEQERFLREKENKAINKTKQSKNTKSDTPASYDIIKAEQKAKTTVPKVQKREKR